MFYSILPFIISCFVKKTESWKASRTRHRVPVGAPARAMFAWTCT